jgi:hypothetical protein
MYCMYVLYVTLDNNLELLFFIVFAVYRKEILWTFITMINMNFT